MNSIKKLTLTLIITSALILISIPSFASTGTITVDTLRARKTPSTSSDVLRNFDSGDKVEIIEKSGDWYKIKLSDNNEAYVYAEYVKLEENATTNENSDQKETTEKTEIKLEKSTQIYILPLLFSNQIGEISETTNVKVVEVINNWVCVEYNGITGWVLNKQNKNEVVTQPQTTTENKTGYINVTSAFLRKEPSKTAEIVESLYLNNEVKILKEADGWCQVQAGNLTGYIFAELISDKQTGTSSRSLSTARTSTTNQVTSTNKTGYVNATTLNVRDSASSTGKVITTLKIKAQIEITGETDSWYKILTTSGEGYISKQYVVDSLDKVIVKTTTTATTKKSNATSATGSASGTAGSVIEYARQYLGCQYVYGGSGPTTFDCSGFTMYVFKHFGVSLPHNASTQSNYGKYVSKENLQPGDLVIFNNYANTSIGHSGIYLGNGQFIHAANSREDVTTDTLNSGYYSIRFVEGRRLV